MSDQLLMFDLTTCGPIVDRNVISLPASGDGATHCGLPDGLTTDLFGRVPVPASLSVPQGRARRPMTGVICGLRGFLSSASAGLQSSLESRLRRRLAGAGSTLFSLIWRRRATPAGRPYYQLVASARRTSGSDFGSWGTPTAQDAKHATASPSEMARDPNNLRIQVHAARLASWATPTSQDHKDGASTLENTPVNGLLGRQVSLASWPTPDTNTRGGPQQPDKRRMGGHSVTLQDAAHGTISTGSPAPTGKRGQLNPALSRWLQGFPKEWDVAAIEAGRSIQTIRRKAE